MPMSESEILLMMRENAALCNLEADVIVALKAYDARDFHLVEQQLHTIMVDLHRIDEVRRRGHDVPLHELP